MTGYRGTYFILGACPVVVALAMLRGVRALAPFSLIADAANVLGEIASSTCVDAYHRARTVVAYLFVQCENYCRYVSAQYALDAGGSISCSCTSSNDQQALSAALITVPLFVSCSKGHQCNAATPWSLSKSAACSSYSLEHVASQIDEHGHRLMTCPQSKHSSHLSLHC